MRIRHELGIPAHSSLGVSKRRWEPAEEALLGTDCDLRVANWLNRTQAAVAAKRASLGIPNFLNKAAHRPIRAEMLVSTTQIHKEKVKEDNNNNNTVITHMNNTSKYLAIKVKGLSHWLWFDRSKTTLTEGKFKGEGGWGLKGAFTEITIDENMIEGEISSEELQYTH